MPATRVILAIVIAALAVVGLSGYWYPLAVFVGTVFVVWLYDFSNEFRYIRGQRRSSAGEADS